jgi:hypothetical protein
MDRSVDDILAELLGDDAPLEAYAPVKVSTLFSARPSVRLYRLVARTLSWAASRVESSALGAIRPDQRMFQEPPQYTAAASSTNGTAASIGSVPCCPGILHRCVCQASRACTHRAVRRSTAYQTGRRPRMDASMLQPHPIPLRLQPHPKQRHMQSTTQSTTRLMEALMH